MTRLVEFIRLIFVCVALSCPQFTANAQGDDAPPEEVANDHHLERKIRVILPSPYEQTNIRRKAPEVIEPTASAPPQVSKPATPAIGSLDLNELAFGQPVQASTFTAPAAPHAGTTFRPSFKQVDRTTEGGAHDLNAASLTDLNSLEGGGMIGRAIVAGRPYRSAEELVTRRILSRATYLRIKAQIGVRSSDRY